MNLEESLNINSGIEESLDSEERIMESLEESLGEFEPVKVPEVKPKVKPESILDIQMKGFEDIQGLSGKEFETFEDKSIIKPTAKLLGKQAVATAELAMSVASGMLLYLPSKAYGLMALPFGREVADIAEEEVGKLGYQPYTKEGRRAAELVGKGFELFLMPARNIGDYVSKLSPRAGYVVELGAELAEFAMIGMIAKKVKGAKAKFKPTVSGMSKLFRARKALEVGAIKAKEKVVGGISDEVVKKVQQKILEVEKQQLELELSALKERLEKGIIKEDLKEKGRKVEEVKSGLRTVEERQIEIDKIFKEEKVEPLKPKPKPKPKPKSLEQKAISKFSETDQPKDAAFITSDGKLISGKDTPNSHHVIAEAVTGKVEEVALAEFISTTGSIRTDITGDFLSLDMAKEPTPKQWKAIKKASESTKGIIVEISDTKGELVEGGSGKFKTFQAAQSFTVDGFKKSVTGLKLFRYGKEKGMFGTFYGSKEYFSEYPGRKDIIKEYLVELKNPLEVDVGSFEGFPAESIIAKYGDRKIINRLKLLKDPEDIMKTMDKWVYEYLQDKGYDGVIYKKEGKPYVVQAVDSRKPITEVDRQTGVDIPALEGEKSPFFQTKEEADAMGKVYEGRKIVDIEVATQEIINRVNRSYHGDKSVDLAKARNELSEIATRADELNMTFDNPVDFNEWKVIVKEAAIWARQGKPLRLIKKQSDGVELYSGIDPTLIKELIKSTKRKVISLSKEFNSEKLEMFKQYFKSLPTPKKLDVLASGKLKPIVNDYTEAFAERMQEVREVYNKNPKKFAKNTELASKLESYEMTGSEINVWFALTPKERMTASWLYEATRDIDRLFNQDMSAGIVIRDLAPGEASIQLYTGIPLDKAGKLIVKIAKRLKRVISHEGDKVTIDYSKLTPEEAKIVKEAKNFHDAFEAARRAKHFDMQRFLNRAHIHTYRAIHERVGILRNDLIKKYGKLGHKVVIYMDAESGSSGHSMRMYDEMISEAFKGVPLKLSTAVDAVNLVQRLRDIYGYKSTKEFRPPKGMNPSETISYYYLMNIFRKLTPKEIAIAEKASNILFDHVKIWIDDMVKVGLKSIEEGESLKAHDYRKLKSTYVQDLYDTKYKVTVGDKLVKQSDSGIDMLGKDAIKMVETDHRVLYMETANRIYRRIDNQETKLTWKKFDEEYPKNPYVIIKENDKVLGRPERMVPRGWVRDFWYDKGEKRAMYFHPDVALQLMSKGSHMSFPLTRFLTNVLGINLTRFLTVGASPAWALTRGLTMDVLHTFFSARVFNQTNWEKTGGKRPWKRLYSPIGPKYIMGELGKDMGSTFYDVFTQGEKTGAYLKAGGKLPFLSMREQEFLGRGIKPPSSYSKFMDGVSFFSKSMEMWNRVAVMERVLVRKAKEKGITLKEIYKDKEMVKEATNASVERLPYIQGGWLVKEMDKVFGPFISASYNAARTFSRGASENLVDFAARVGNIGVPTVGLTIASIMYASEAHQDIPDWAHVRSACFPFFPDSLNFIDENGNKRYMYIKMPLEPNVATFYNIFRSLTHKALYEMGLTKIEPNYDAIVKSIISSLPTDTPLSPTINSWFTYFRNKEPWRDRKIVPEKFPWPKSGEEGKFDLNVSQMAKDIGQPLGISPPRLEAAAKQFGVQSNEFTWALGKLYDAKYNDLDPRLRRQHWAITISRIPGLKNLMGITVPRAHRIGPKENARVAEKFDTMLRNQELNFLSEGYHWKGVGSRQEIDEFIRSHKNVDIKETLRKKDRFIRNTKDLPHRRYWSDMYFSSPKYKAEEYYKLINMATPKEYEQIMKEKSILTKAGGFFTENFWLEFRKIRREKE